MEACAAAGRHYSGRMRIGGEKPLLPILFALLLLAGGAALGVLQVYWVGVASRSEESRARLSLSRVVMQVSADSEEEVRALLSVSLLSADDMVARNWRRLSDGLAFWYTYTRFPDLLRAIYVVSRATGGDVFSYSRAAGTLVPSVLPGELARALPGAFSMQDKPPHWPTAALAAGRRIVVLPVPPREGPVFSQSPAGAVVAVLDTRVLYQEVVPFYMERNLADFPYRLIATGTGEVLARAGEVGEKQPPEAVAGITSLGVIDADRLGERESRPGAYPGAPSYLDPLLDAWLRRAQGATTPLALPPPLGARAPSAEAQLMVYYPRGTLAGAYRAQQALNIGVSLGVLAALMASVFALSRLYRRSVVLRAREQEFVASMGHELRTPISVIQAASENLSRGVVSDPARLPRYADAIHGQIRRLSGMVESILLFAGLESGKAREPSRAPVDLPDLVREILQPIEQLAEQRGSRVTFSAPPRLALLSDRIALRLIVENLVVNAIRHADPGDIRVVVVPPDDGRVRIVVEDDGPGIPRREQSRVFEPFARAERSVRDQHPGSGLGLHLVRRIAALLGGNVVLASPYDAGSAGERPGCRFTVTLPFVVPDDDR